MPRKITSEFKRECAELVITHGYSHAEADHNFAELGAFVFNEHGNLHVVDISNNPNLGSVLGALTRGLAWIRNPENH